MKRNKAVIAVFVVLMVAMTAFAQTKRPAEKVKDPVCGLMVEKNSELSASYKGTAYYFCSKADMEQFKKTPEKYVKR